MNLMVVTNLGYKLNLGTVISAHTTKLKGVKLWQKTFLTKFI